MINGFEDETHELTDKELKLVEIIVPKLSKNIGKDKAVKNNKIRDFLLSKGYKVGQARIRKLMHHIRVSNRVENLIATSRGYYRAESVEEVKVYVESLHQRARSIIEVANSYGV